MRKIKGMTLVELLVAMGVALFLCSMVGVGYRVAVDRSRSIQCLANLRTIVAGTLSFAVERNGMLWTREDVGFSAFRMADDPLGLPQLLQDYLPNKKVWLCPDARPALTKFGNTYTWTVSSQFDTKPIFTVNSQMKTLLFWDAYNYSLPSMYNASEPDNGGKFPKALKKEFWRHPHSKRKKSNWAFSDGHIISGETAAQ